MTLFPANLRFNVSCVIMTLFWTNADVSEGSTRFVRQYGSTRGRTFFPEIMRVCLTGYGNTPGTPYARYFPQYHILFWKAAGKCNILIEKKSLLT